MKVKPLVVEEITPPEKKLKVVDFNKPITDIDKFNRKFSEADIEAEWETVTDRAYNGRYNNPDSASGNKSGGCIAIFQDTNGVWQSAHYGDTPCLGLEGRGKHHDPLDVMCAIKNKSKIGILREYGYLDIDAIAEFQLAGVCGNNRTSLQIIDPLADLKSLSTTHSLDEMEKNLKNDKFVICAMHLLGTMGVFFAKPNTGKTLLILALLIQSIESNLIDPDNMFYLNFDDSYKGQVEKTRLAKQHGFHMVSPGTNGVNSEVVIGIIRELVATGQAKGLVLVFDTLKKFTDVMDKRIQKTFYELLRTVVLQNGTVIILSHANKHLSADGDLIPAGTQDIIDDVDSAYGMYQLESSTDKRSIVEFRCIKSRGNLEQTQTYQYEKADNYNDILNSVILIGEDESKRISFQTQYDKDTEKDKPIVELILRALDDDIHKKTEIYSFCSSNSVGRRKVDDVLLRYEQGKMGFNNLWYHRKGEHNSKLYYRTDIPLKAPSPPLKD